MLEEILTVKKKEIKELYAAGYEYRLTTSERDIPTLPFEEALRSPTRRSALIAEVKKASPSKGIIREDFDPVEIAKAYEQAGADCLSVLTDSTFFMGDPAYIAWIKAQVSLPVLRKDFIIDPIQVKQSVELGADAILLIAKALSAQQLKELDDQAQELGLDVLIEVSSKEELEQVLRQVSPAIIGINNRDLSTFITSTDMTKELLPHIPDDVLVISESGIHSAQIVKELEQHGVGGFLVGEHLMKQDNIPEAVRSLYA